MARAAACCWSATVRLAMPNEPPSCWTISDRVRAPRARAGREPAVDPVIVGTIAVPNPPAPMFAGARLESRDAPRDTMQLVRTLWNHSQTFPDAGRDVARAGGLLVARTGVSARQPASAKVYAVSD